MKSKPLSCVEAPLQRFIPVEYHDRRDWRAGVRFDYQKLPSVECDVVGATDAVPTTEIAIAAE
jgi:hypothetical protein